MLLPFVGSAWEGPEFKQKSFRFPPSSFLSSRDRYSARPCHVVLSSWKQWGPEPEPPVRCLIGCECRKLPSGHVGFVAVSILAGEAMWVFSAWPKPRCVIPVARPGRYRAYATVANAGEAEVCRAPRWRNGSTDR